ncbi:MAG: hypothetical protein JW701_07020, partial [Kosmotogaceae bacterium]|nr:hypothetical protein [Kosmotogaceae bacterium]
KSVLAKYTFFAVLVLAVILMLLSSRGRVDEFNPESVFSTIEETSFLFISEKILSEGEKMDHLEIVSNGYREIEWGLYSYEAHLKYYSSGAVRSLYTVWDYRVRDDSIDLSKYSLDGEEWLEP